MFRGMLAMMGAGPVRGSDALIGWLPAATSGRFGVEPHWSQADRKAFRKTFDRQSRRGFHRYMADARRAEDILGMTEAALTGPLKDRPLLTIFGARNDPLKFQPRWKKLFPAAQQHVIAGATTFRCATHPPRSPAR